MINIKKLTGFFTKDIVLFVLVIVLMATYYGYQKSSFYPPHGLHQWRQSVGAAYAMNYYNYNLDITQPRIYNYIAQKGETDKTIAESPILYYLVAVFYKIFGPDDAIFRIINAIILFIGMFYLFKAGKLVLEDKFWSLLIPVFLFTSATLVYYGNSFLPDTTALAFVFIAFFFVVKYSGNPNTSNLYLAALFYTIAGLLKVTSFLSLIALISTFLLFTIISKSFRSRFKLLPLIIPALIPFVVVLIWYYFVDYYNTNFGGAISPVAIRPIWIVAEDQIASTWARIEREWIHSYFHIGFHYLVGSILLISIILMFFKKANRFLTTLSIICLIGGLGFFILFFRSFKDHDYYMINVFVVWLIVLFNGILLLKKIAPKVYRFIPVKLGVLILPLYYMTAVPPQIDFKYFGYYNHLHKSRYSGFVGIEDVNRNLGIRQKDLVISIPDASIDISLYLMNQPGFTDFGFINKSGKERIEFFISKGAKYLLISDSTLYSKHEYEFLDEFTNKKLGSYKNVDIYKLPE